MAMSTRSPHPTPQQLIARGIQYGQNYLEMCIPKLLGAPIKTK